jgi:predicted RNA-binding protein with TRAM domain
VGHSGKYSLPVSFSESCCAALIEVKNINGHGEGVVNFDGDMIYVKNAVQGKNKIEIIEIKRTFVIAQKI